QSKLVKYFSRQLSCKRKVALQERNAKLEGFPQLLHWFRIVDIRKEVMEEIAPGQLSLEDLLDMTDDQVCATVKKFGANSEECARLNASLSCLRSVHKSGGSLSKQDWTIQWPSAEPGKENSPGCPAEPRAGRTHPSPKVQPKCGQHRCHAGSPHGPAYAHLDRLTVEGPPGLCPPLEPGHRSLPPSPRQRHAAHTPPRTPNIVTTVTPPGTPPVRRRNKLKPPGTPPPSSRKLIHLIPGFTALHRSKSHEFQLGHRVDEAHTPNLPTLPGNNSCPISHPALPSGSGKPFPVSCPSIPCPQSLSSSPGAPLGPGRGSELSLEPSVLQVSTPSSPSLAPEQRGSSPGSSSSSALTPAAPGPSCAELDAVFQLGCRDHGWSVPGVLDHHELLHCRDVLEGSLTAQTLLSGSKLGSKGEILASISLFVSKISEQVFLPDGPFPPIPKLLALTGKSQGMVRNALGCVGGCFQVPLLPARPRGLAPRSSAGTSSTFLSPRTKPQGGGPSPVLVGGFPHSFAVPDALFPPQNEEGAEEVQESEDDFEEMNLSLLSARNFPRKASQTSIFLQEWDIPFEQLEIGELIGKGRFGQVFHGRWHGEVAIRLIDIERDNEDQLKAFKREVMAYRQTRHENVVLFMGACMSPPHLAIITSLCKGRTLYSVVRDAKIVLDVNKTRQIAQEIVKGMGYLHAKGILHKDLKSKNVFYDNGKVVITDFGLFSISGVLQAGRRENKLRIQNGWLCHLAPEIIRQLSPDTEEDKLPFSKHSDVFALGTIWYELHAREWPFKTQPAEAIIWQVGRGMKPNLSQIGMGKEISDILLFCWAYEQEERPTFTKLMDMLEKLPKRNRRLSHPGHFWKSAE
ncbi:KSR2 Kinase, partial [Sylvietta virens]|nr:KSR2 Kinase [Sylvietta virens]